MTNKGLSGASSCICELSFRIAYFCFEDEEEFAGMRDPDDHFCFACAL